MNRQQPSAAPSPGGSHGRASSTGPAQHARKRRHIRCHEGRPRRNRPKGPKNLRVDRASAVEISGQYIPAMSKTRNNSGRVRATRPVSRGPPAAVVRERITESGVLILSGLVFATKRSSCELFAALQIKPPSYCAVAQTATLQMLLECVLTLRSRASTLTPPFQILENISTISTRRRERYPCLDHTTCKMMTITKVCAENATPVRASRLKVQTAQQVSVQPKRVPC